MTSSAKAQRPILAWNTRNTAESRERLAEIRQNVSENWEHMHDELKQLTVEEKELWRCVSQYFAVKRGVGNDIKGVLGVMNEAIKKRSEMDLRKEILGQSERSFGSLQEKRALEARRTCSLSPKDMLVRLLGLRNRSEMCAEMLFGTELWRTEATTPSILMGNDSKPPMSS
jgi:hypothetical protein